MLRRAEAVTYATERYAATIDPVARRLLVESSAGRVLLDVPLATLVDTIEVPDGLLGEMAVVDVRSVPEGLDVHLEVGSSLWGTTRIALTLADNYLRYRVEVSAEDAAVLDARFFVDPDVEAGRTDLAKVYAPRFDWFEAQVHVEVDQHESLGAQQWLSPPPLTYVLHGPEHVWVAAAPEPGAYTFQSFDYTGTAGVSFRLAYEGHTRVRGAFRLPDLVIGFGSQSPNGAVEASIRHLREHGYLAEPPQAEVPDWWAEPIFCGWGQMRYDYRRDHWGHENGTFINVTAYCTELRYRNYLTELDRAGIDPGTIIVDMGWAEDPASARPHPGRWHDLRAFVDEQHGRGRRVLLWYTPFVVGGLPPAACMTLGGEPVAPDPSAPAWVSHTTREIRRMIDGGPDGLDADGLKIDFTQCVPSEDGRFVSRIPHFAGLINETDASLIYPRISEGRRELIRTHGPGWGIETVRQALAVVHAAAKSAKPDAMILAHAANPYFADVVDVLRLNDLDGECDDVVGVMTNRAALARMCSPSWLIDTDDDLMIDRRRWREYAEVQPAIGIPDTYYVTGIAHSLETLGEDDHARLRAVWGDYRAARAAR